MNIRPLLVSSHLTVFYLLFGRLIIGPTLVVGPEEGGGGGARGKGPPGRAPCGTRRRGIIGEFPKTVGGAPKFDHDSKTTNGYRMKTFLREVHERVGDKTRTKNEKKRQKTLGYLMRRGWEQTRKESGSKKQKKNNESKTFFSPCPVKKKKNANKWKPGSLPLKPVKGRQKDNREHGGPPRGAWEQGGSVRERKPGDQKGGVVRIKERQEVSAPQPPVGSRKGDML